MSKNLLTKIAPIALFLALASAPAWAELPTLDLAKMDPADLAKGWSDAKADGGVSFREAAKGGMATFSTKVWWEGQSLRPPENTQYVLEVRYKDTVTAPVIASSFGGLERYHGPGEIHRFGGSGDGQWKTAAVAVGWDQILRTGDKVSFGLTANADLPVASVKFRPATAEDAARHNAETRAWLAQVQAAKRKATPLEVKDKQFKKDVPAGPVAFAWSPLVCLLQDAQPKDDQIGGTIKVRMTTNELEGGAFGVYANGQDVKGVTYKVSDLTGPAGKLVADVVPRTAEYALLPKGKSGYKWFPQRLWPAFAVDIAKGQSHWFLFNLRTHRGKTQPGLYKGEVAITSECGKATLPVEVEVLPVDLLTMDEAKLFMGGCVTGLVPAHDIEFAVDYNQNGINLWYSGIQPAPSIKDNKLVLDFSILDEWMAAAKKRGLVGNVWFLGGNPYGYPTTMTIFRSMGTIDSRDGRKPPSAAEWIKTQQLLENRNKPMAKDRELVVEWVRQTTAHAQEKNWPEVILTPFDEPAKWVQGTADGKGNLGTGPWIETYFKDACAAIREGNKDTRIYGSIHHINRSGKNEGLVFLSDIDLFCTNAIHEDSKVGDKVRAAGKTFWQYSGGDVPDQARFGYGFYFASYGSVGSLRWAYNWGAGYDTTEGENWMYAWHTPFDTIPAPSYEGMREAWDDRRIIETYKKKFAGDAEAMAVLTSIFKEASGSRGAGGRDTVSDFWTAVDDVNKLDRWRNQLLDRLAKAK